MIMAPSSKANYRGGDASSVFFDDRVASGGDAAKLYPLKDVWGVTPFAEARLSAVV